MYILHHLGGAARICLNDNFKRCLRHTRTAPYNPKFSLRHALRFLPRLAACVVRNQGEAKEVPFMPSHLLNGPPSTLSISTSDGLVVGHVADVHPLPTSGSRR